MKVIYKYEISPDGTVVAPIKHQRLKIASQNGLVFMWAIVEPLAVCEEQHLFEIVATGVIWTEGVTAGDYLETVFVEPGLVFHVFRRPS